ncbi:MAG: sulfatase [Rikenellaceae bacterium]
MKRTLLLSASAAALTLAAQAQIAEKPNILWVMAEDMGQDLSCYGMGEVQTPILDRMANEGVQYNTALCSSPISSPNRSAMMTGVHQTSINAHNHRSNRDVPLTTKVQPITYHLRQAGYTCILGNEGVMRYGRKIDCNFKTQETGEWDGVTKFGLFDKVNTITAEDQPFFAQVQLVVTHRGDWWKQVRAESKKPIDPDKVVMPPYLPDHPLVRLEWATYLDQVERMDSEMGGLLEYLKKAGVLDNTIIFFIGDNGRCDIKGKGYLYEPGIRIPMIAWGKGIQKCQVDDVVSTLDISATVLDLAGCELPSYLDGKPLFKKSTGESVKTNTTFYSARDNWDEIPECIRSVSDGKFKYIRNYFPEQPWDMHQQYLEFHRPALHVMRALKAAGKLCDAGMLFLAESKPYEELYNVEKDPHELNNLAENPKYRKQLVALRESMERWQNTHNDMGLADRFDRDPERIGPVIEFAQEKYPEEWKAITDGNVTDMYSKIRSECMKSLKKK